MTMLFEANDGMVWKQRVYIEGKNAEDYYQYLSLMEEAMRSNG